MYSILVLGIVGAGGIFTGCNPSYTPTELIHHIKTSQASVVISSPEPDLLKPLLQAAEQTGIPKSNTLIFDLNDEAIPEGFTSWRTLFEQGEQDWERFDDPEICKNTTAARLFSSGTTGLPKVSARTSPVQSSDRR